MAVPKTLAPVGVLILGAASRPGSPSMRWQGRSKRVRRGRISLPARLEVSTRHRGKVPMEACWSSSFPEAPISFSAT